MMWEKKTLGDVAEIFSGYAFKSTDMNAKEGIPLIKIKNIFDFSVSNQCDTFLNKEFNLEKFKRYHLQNNDFLVAMTGQGSVGRIGKMRDYESGYYVNQRVAVVRVDPNIVYPDFIFYQIATASNEIELFKKANGAGQPNISAKQIGELPVLIPPKVMQQHIAGILSPYDMLIKNNQKQIKLLEEAAQRLYKEWFVDLRFPGHEDVAIVDGVPEGWCKDRADNFFKITIGKTPPRAEKQWFVNNGGIPWLSISDMGNSGVFVFNTSEALTAEAIDKHNMKIVPEGTIFVSFKLTVGRVAIATSDMCTNEAIAHFYIDEDFKQAYTYCYLKNFEYDTLGNTSSISKAVNSKIIKAMPFIMPDEATIFEFERLVAPILKEIKTKQAACIKLTEARNRLLPKLMSGEIEV